ncbi:unnamed protein product [Amaranthus hypochondriacus]
MANPPTNITISAALSNNPNNNIFNIIFNNNRFIQTTVTSDPVELTYWLNDISGASASIIGLDIEWRPNLSTNAGNPVATLQLCSTNIFSTTTCLIFQFLYCPVPLPSNLFGFLDNERYTFVGVGIRSDAEMLLECHGLRVRNVVDIADLFADKIRGTRTGMGLKELAQVVLNVNVAKPREVTMSKWDAEWLSYQQIQYACIDAFLSYEIGKILIALPSIPHIDILEQLI